MERTVSIVRNLFFRGFLLCSNGSLEMLVASFQLLNQGLGKRMPEDFVFLTCSVHPSGSCFSSSGRPLWNFRFLALTLASMVSCDSFDFSAAGESGTRARITPLAQWSCPTPTLTFTPEERPEGRTASRSRPRLGTEVILEVPVASQNTTHRPSSRTPPNHYNSMIHSRGQPPQQWQIQHYHSNIITITSHNSQQHWQRIVQNATKQQEITSSSYAFLPRSVLCI